MRQYCCSSASSPLDTYQHAHFTTNKVLYTKERIVLVLFLWSISTSVGVKTDTKVQECISNVICHCCDGIVIYLLLRLWLQLSKFYTKTVLCRPIIHSNTQFQLQENTKVSTVALSSPVKTESNGYMRACNCGESNQLISLLFYTTVKFSPFCPRSSSSCSTSIYFSSANALPPPGSAIQLDSSIFITGRNFKHTRRSSLCIIY